MFDAAGCERDEAAAVNPRPSFPPGSARWPLQSFSSTLVNATDLRSNQGLKIETACGSTPFRLFCQGDSR
jgi:hypothetical protein